MKYTIAILTILSFTSCKKEYNCRCTDKDGGEVYSSHYKIKKSEYDNQKTECEKEAIPFAAQNPLKVPITCTLN